jgi:hypothetical protein
VSSLSPVLAPNPAWSLTSPTTGEQTTPGVSPSRQLEDQIRQLWDVYIERRNAYLAVGPPATHQDA